MSSGCGDVLSLADLQTAKKHQIFEAEVITGKSGGVAGGADIGYATNQVTGQVQVTLPEILKNLGFKPGNGDFTTGFTVTSGTRDHAWYDPVSFNWYSYLGTIPLSGYVVPPGTNPVGDPNWMPVTTYIFTQAGAGAVPRAAQDKMRESVSVEDFGAIGDGIVNDTLAIQMAIDYVYYILGRGAVNFGPKNYLVDASPLSETYDNYGVPVAASTGCLIDRKGVSLIGVKGKTKLTTANKNATLIYMIAPAGNVVSGIEIDGGWNPGDAGGNNGIFTLGTQGGADISCERVTFSDLYIHNVASYGLALQNGNPKGVSIDRIRVDNIGADALDLKARGGLVSLARGNNVSNVWASRYGQRVDGSSAIDVRGIWNLRGITATDFGGDSTKNYVGVRFRTKPAPSDPQQVADKSTLTGFTIIPTPGSAAASISGIECGSDDIHVSNGYVEDCTHGVIYFGNANGSAIRGTITDVTSVNARQYGFRSVAGTQGITFKGCVDVGAVTAGFRIEGDNCNADVCVGTLSVSSGALPTFQQSGCRFGASWVVTERQNDTSVSVTAKGTATDIALRLSVKGNSFVGFNGDLRPDTANTKYLGSGSLPMAGGFTQTAFTVTSDERLKVNIASLLNSKDEEKKAEFKAMIAAWREVDFFTYQFIDRVEKKKAEGVEARWHLGVIAQRAIAVFTKHGLDWTKYAIFNYDKWDAKPTVCDEDGEVIFEAIDAGDKYTINYEEALILEAVSQRDRCDSIEARLSALESK